MSTATKNVRKIIRIDEDKCNGCGECVPNCAEGAIEIIDGKAKLVSDSFCDGLGACLGHCPEDALIIEEREADGFDEEAVQLHIEAQSRPDLPPSSHPAGPPSVFFGGCPSAAVREMKPRESAEVSPLSGETSALTQWPIQLHLVPPAARFLKGADLLLAADCVPFAYAGFHSKLLKGRAVLISCPKLDDTSPYFAKLVEILETADLKSLTIAHMEVPCCFGLVQLAEQAVQKAGVNVPVRVVNISVDGQPRSDSAEA